MTTRNGKAKENVKSIVKSALILTCLSEGFSSLGEIAQKVRLSPSTVHRLLKTLESTGMASQDPASHHYYLGPLITRLSTNPRIAHYDLTSRSIEEMKLLWETSEETVALDILIGGQPVRVQEIPSKYGLKVTESGRIEGSFFSGATAKVLLSQLSEKELAGILAKTEIVQGVPNSNTEVEKLKTRLKQVREQGYAVTIGERAAGAVGISVPIKHYPCPAALSILGPEQRLKPHIERLLTSLKQSSRRISDSLRHR